MFGTGFHDFFQFLWFGVGKNAAHHELKHHISVSVRAKPKKNQINQDLVYICIFGVVKFIELYAMV